MKFSEYFSTVVALLKKKAFFFKDCVWQPPKEHLRKTADTFKLQYVSVLFIIKTFKISQKK